MIWITTDGIAFVGGGDPIIAVQMLISHTISHHYAHDPFIQQYDSTRPDGTCSEVQLTMGYL